MAITPEDTKRITSEDIQEISNYERAIDQFLRENDDGFKKLKFKLPLGIKFGIIIELCKRYDAAGWNQIRFDGRNLLFREENAIN